nr:hypothetical protein [Tanacetum cinerariifolium]
MVKDIIAQINQKTASRCCFATKFDVIVLTMEDDRRGNIGAWICCFATTLAPHRKRIQSAQKPQNKPSRQMRREGVLLLRGLDSRLTKDLLSDLQKLRCKVAFHVLRFAPLIFELGSKITKRMRSKGLYLALHLRMEKDVWHDRKLAGLYLLNAVKVTRYPGMTEEMFAVVLFIETYASVKVAYATCTQMRMLNQCWSGDQAFGAIL